MALRVVQALRTRVGRGGGGIRVKSMCKKGAGSSGKSAMYRLDMEIKAGTQVVNVVELARQ